MVIGTTVSDDPDAVAASSGLNFVAHFGHVTGRPRYASGRLRLAPHEGQTTLIAMAVKT
jgi:hypothetical protein